jgi:upstream activation factor subunit UAF30
MSSAPKSAKVSKSANKKVADPAPIATPVEDVPVTPAITEEVVAEEVVAVVPLDVSVAAKFETTLSGINEALNTIKLVQSQVKQMAKDFVKIVKAAGKKTRRSASTAEGGVKKNPSGFAKPTALSVEMCDFLGMPHGTELARTDVTRRLTKYIKDHELQDVADKRNIRPDAKLDAILTIPEGKQLTFFNLQSFIKHNFVKQA